MHILVTGAAGFIGSHLCERLLARGDHVVGLDNFDPFYGESIKRDNLSVSLASDRFILVEADIRDRSAVLEVMTPCLDAVVHLAAKAGVRPSIEDPIGYQDCNMSGTATLLEAARQSGGPHFVFASSSSVYGNNEKVPFAENDPVDHPISPYAATKKAGELLCHTYHHLFDMSMTCLRFFTVYGPRQRPDLAIHKFARLILDDMPIPVFGDGSMERDFTYIDDILSGVVAAIDRPRGFRVYNLGESRPVRLDTLISELERSLGRSARIERMPLQPGDVRRTYADITLAGNELDYDPQTEISTGLDRFVRWLDESMPSDAGPLK